jgi:hypothetical protein
MYYRLEVINGVLGVVNVETDVLVGLVHRPLVPDPENPGRLISFPGCIAADIFGRKIACIFAEFCPPYISAAISAVAWAQEQKTSYADAKDKSAGPPPDFTPVECLLGEILADAVVEKTHMLDERRAGFLTKERLDGLMSKLLDIWFASSFGSYNSKRRTDEPYFRNTPASRPRLSFIEAAQQYGMRELRCRFFDEPDAVLKEHLSLVLEDLKLLCDQEAQLPPSTLPSSRLRIIRRGDSLDVFAAR